MILVYLLIGASRTISFSIFLGPRMQQSTPESKNPRPLYLWEDPPVSSIQPEPVEDEGGYVTLRMSKKEYNQWTALVDVRPWKKYIAATKPRYLRRRP
jgi:hypothetical protein